VRGLWLAFIAVLVASFVVLGWVGTRIYQEAPPIPDRVVTSDGRTVVDDGAVSRGQNVWQSMGGMEVGSIWGHGSYVAPDWTADWLHREAVFILDKWAVAEFGRPYGALPAERQSQLQGRLQALMRRNDYDARTGTLTVDPVRAEAFEANLRHYTAVFSDGHVGYAIPKGAVDDPERLRDLSAFYFWTAWAASAQRPGDDISYTQNWPHEPLVGNRPTGEAVVWTGVSILMLLAGICAMVWWYASRSPEPPHGPIPQSDPLETWVATPSQAATLWYFRIVAGLILAQIALGIVTAHYGVEGDGFYGIPLSKWLPYSVRRVRSSASAPFWARCFWWSSDR